MAGFGMDSSGAGKRPLAGSWEHSNDMGVVNCR
jgi:hypothetical protein